MLKEEYPLFSKGPQTHSVSSEAKAEVAFAHPHIPQKLNSADRMFVED